MELQVIQSKIDAADSADGQPHIKQRAYPVPTAKGESLDDLLRAIKEWFTECQRIDAEGVVRGEIGGQPVEFKAPAPVFGKNSKATASEVIGIIRRGLPLIHNQEIRDVLKAEFGKPAVKATAAAKTKALDLGNLG